MTTEPDKWCSGCEEFKPRTTEFFYRHAERRDGLQGWCKACTGRARNRRQSSPEGKKVKAEYAAKRYKDPLLEPQHKARTAIENAKRAGRIPRKAKCVCCGKPATHWHHSSYFEEHRRMVWPLCDRCHTTNEHRLLTAIGFDARVPSTWRDPTRLPLLIGDFPLLIVPPHK